LLTIITANLRIFEVVSSKSDVVEIYASGSCQGIVLLLLSSLSSLVTGFLSSLVLLPLSQW
jgi:hypothetical protein